MWRLTCLQVVVVVIVILIVVDDIGALICEDARVGGNLLWEAAALLGALLALCI